MVWNLNSLSQLLKSFPLFTNFPEKIVLELAKASEVLEVPANTQILSQGQLNDYLYFLATGEVGVYVDGGRVSKMNKKGDLLGEMSVISSKPAAATILSEGDITLVRLNTKIFLDSSGSDRDYYTAILYRIYATVLSDKLNATNQKAKHFEQMTLALQATEAELKEANEGLEKKVEERTAQIEQKNTELQTGMNKMEELNNSKRYIFQKLIEFDTLHLAPLKNLLDQARQKLPQETAIGEARQVVFDIQQKLGPLTSMYSLEQQIQNQRVLLAEPNKKQQLVAKMALGGSGVKLDIVGTTDEGLAKLKEQKYDLIFMDAQTLEIGNRARTDQPQAGLVLMTSDSIPSYLPALKALSSMPNIVSRDENDRTFTLKNIITTVNKLVGRDLFGLEKYLNWGVDVQSAPIVGSKHRKNIAEKVDQYFESVGVRRSNRERILSVLEEMLMNAIYDAPTDATGKHVYNHLPRTEEVTLRPEEQGLVRFATDGMLAAISVQDPFGSLSGGTILRYLEANYGSQIQDMNAREGKGGAGRGLHNIVESSDLVVFNIETGKKTESIALFNVETKDVQRLNPSFHLFIKS